VGGDAVAVLFLATNATAAQRLRDEYWAFAFLLPTAHCQLPTKTTRPKLSSGLVVYNILRS
jgi:hypothetical protein